MRGVPNSRTPRTRAAWLRVRPFIQNRTMRRPPDINSDVQVGMLQDLTASSAVNLPIIQPGHLRLVCRLAWKSIDPQHIWRSSAPPRFTCTTTLMFSWFRSVSRELATNDDQQTDDTSTGYNLSCVASYLSIDSDLSAEHSDRRVNCS